MNDLPFPEQLLTLLNASVDPLGIVDADGRYVWVNDVSVRAFGYLREEVLGSHFREHLLPDDGPHNTMSDALAGHPGMVVRRVQCADGSTVVERTELLPLGNGYVLIHASDLTALYGALDRAHETEERYRELLVAVRVPMAIWWRSHEGAPPRVRYVNDALCALLERPAEALLDHNPAIWVQPSDLSDVTEHLVRVAEGEPSAPARVQLRRANGSIASCLLVAAPVTYEGRPAMSAQFVDISEEVRLRDLASRSDAADLALTVAGGIAHDFGNIFTGLLAYLDFATELMDDGAPAAPHVRSARLAAERASVLTRALRDYSTSAGQLTDTRRGADVVRLADVVNEAYTIMRAAIARTVSMTVHVGEEPVYALVPSDSLLRVLVNLLVNARDATLERAATAEPGYRPSITLNVEARPSDRRAVVTVTDNGTGIPDAIAERIFDTHFTTKGKGGSGLGLTVARDLARAAGGDLTFSSKRGEGTTFALALPLAPPLGEDAS